MRELQKVSQPSVHHDLIRHVCTDYLKGKFPDLHFRVEIFYEVMHMRHVIKVWLAKEEGAEFVNVYNVEVDDIKYFNHMGPIIPPDEIFAAVMLVAG